MKNCTKSCDPNVEARSEALKTEWKGPEVDAPLNSAGGWLPTGLRSPVYSSLLTSNFTLGSYFLRLSSANQPTWA